MRWAVLGPVAATIDGQALALGSPQQRGALAYLLINANLLISPEQLVQALWGTAAPASARTQVYGYVSRLRRVVGPRADAVLTGGAAGYRLTAVAADLDLAEFTDLTGRARGAVAGGRPAEAVQRYRAALDLWTGSALSGAAGAYVAPAAVWLEEQRLVAAEELTDAELGLGRHATLVPQLHALVEANPLRERLVGQLMLALHRGGRQAEALAVFSRFRHTLGGEHGLDPGQRLAELHQSIIRSDPRLLALGGPAPAISTSLAESGAPDRTGAAPGPPQARPAAAMPSVMPAQLPAPVAGFVGRQDQLRALTALVPPGPIPAGSTIAITGTAGVGKTALAVSWAHLMADRFPDGQLYANLRGFDAGGVADPADVLGGFLEAFQIPAERVPTDPQARTGLYRSLLAGRRMLVVLDNARDAHQVRPLLTGTSGCLVVVTSRDQLTGLVAADGAHPITVDLMSPAEAHQVLTGRLGTARLAAEPDAVAEIIARCARLPLALAIAAARAAAQPRLPLRRLADQLRGAHDGLDAFTVGDTAVDIRAVLSWSYHALSPPTARLFRLLAVHPGPDLSAAAAASLAGLPLRPASTSLAELTRAHLVTEHRPGRYAFHDLLRVYAADLVQAQEPDPSRRAAVHRMLDHHLHTAHTAHSLLPAQHPPIPLPDLQPGVTVEPLADAGAAREWFIAESAALTTLIDQASQTGFDPYVWRLALMFTDVLDQQGHWQDWLTVMHAAVAASGRTGDLPEQARAYRHLARAFARLSQYAQAHTCLERALQLHQAAGDQMGRADTLLTVAFLCDRQGRHRDALGHARQVQDLYRAADYRYGLARALNNVGWLHAKVGEPRQALNHCQQALALFQEQADHHGQAYTWDSLGYIHHQLGRHNRAVDCYQQALALLRSIGDRHFEASALTRLGDVHKAAGDYPAARKAWSEALAILRDLNHPDADQVGARLQQHPGHHDDQLAHGSRRRVVPRFPARSAARR